MMPEYHGKGIMQEALTPVLEYGFNIMKLHTVEADADPENAPSIKLLERNKFVKEAHFKKIDSSRESISIPLFTHALHTDW
jgi:ribosomal-protein-alanine N-acetyltransferase